MSRLHRESHLVARIGWLRAAVLGANDGIISTASLVLGVASAASSQNEALTAGVAGLVAGAMSMAAGEYVSFSSQFDTERADLARESGELANDRNFRRGGARSNLCWAGRREWACSRSRTAAYGQGCSRFPRSRRAWCGSSGTSSPHVRRYFFNRRGRTSRARTHLAPQPVASVRFHWVFGSLIGGCEWCASSPDEARHAGAKALPFCQSIESIFVR